MASQKGHQIIPSTIKKNRVRWYLIMADDLTFKGLMTFSKQIEN